MTQPPVKTLILGLLADLPLAQTKPFFLSLEKAGYRGDVCLIAGGLDAATQAFVRPRAFRVNLVPFRKPYLHPGWVRLAGGIRIFLSRNRRRRFEDQLALSCLHPHCARHFYYQSYLEACGAEYDRVMLTDIRDVLFQRDPFDFAPAAELGVFLEDRRWNIGACRHTGNQIRRAFGRAALRRLSGKRVVCAGITIGSTAAIREHLAGVTNLLRGRVERRTIDQGVHNYLIHQHPSTKLTCFENFAGPVLSMARLDRDQLRFDRHDRILDAAGNIINTLHQYDRHPELAARLLLHLGQS